MKTITITKKDLDKDNFYKEPEIGTWDNYENVSVVIEENLGYVRFKKGVYVNGSVLAEAGSGIEAGDGIKAGLGIEAGEGIKAGSGIEAGLGIKAGLGIEAGDGITSLYSWIRAKLAVTFSTSCTISAGIFSTSGAQDIECQEINGGKVIYGNLKLLPKENRTKKDLLSKADELIAKANELKEEANKL